MKRLLFPFAPLFSRLNLRQRWWHRLAVVVFFLAFIGAVPIVGIFTGDVPQSLSPDERRRALTTSFPQLESPEDTLAGIDYDFVEIIPAKPKEAAASETQGTFDGSKNAVHEGIDCYDGQG